MDKLEGMYIIHLCHHHANSHPLSQLSMWSRLHIARPPPPLLVTSDITPKS